jgi:hypothetical protein
MSSELYAGDGFDGTGDGPVAAAARRYFRSLLAVFLLVSAVVTAAASSVDLTAVVPASAVSVGFSPRPLSAFRLAVEVGTLSGLLAAGVALVRFLGRDRRVSLSRGRRHAAVAAVAFAAGTVGGAALLPTAVATAGSVAAGSVGPYWVAEVCLFFPVAVGFAAAAPFLLAAAVRASVVGRFTSTRERGYVALAFVAFAACFSPADGATFVLYAAPLFAGFAGGVAWLEFR